MSHPIVTELESEILRVCALKEPRHKYDLQRACLSSDVDYARRALKSDHFIACKIALSGLEKWRERQEGEYR